MPTKTDQLRVRLNKEERQRLEEVIHRRGRNETISDIVREALTWCLSPAPDKEPVHVDAEAMRILEDLSSKLRREQGQVLKDCLIAVQRAAENRTMLIVEELKLIRKHARETGSGPMSPATLAKGN